MEWLKKAMEFVGGWPGVIAILLGLLGIAYGVYARSHPKSGTIGYRLVSQPLLARSSAGLKVVYDRKQIPEPQLVTLELFNIGPGDLAPTDLDGGFLWLDSNPALFVAILEGGDVSSLAHQDGSRGSRVVLAPGILKAGEGLTVSLLASGNDIVRSHVINELTSLAEGDHRSLSVDPVFTLKAKVNHFTVVNRVQVRSETFGRKFNRALRQMSPLWSLLSPLSLAIPLALDDRESARRELERVRNQPGSTVGW
jgi:hypothetical protein